MRGFIIGTIATAITFAIVAFLLPQIDYGDSLAGLHRRRGHRGRGQRRDQADHQAVLAAAHADDVRAVRPGHQRRAAAADRLDVEPRGHHVHGRRVPAGLRRSARSSRRSSAASPSPSSGPSSGWWSTTDAAEADLAAALRAVRAAGSARRSTLTDLPTLEAACRDVDDAFPDPIVRQYSVKANDVPAVIGAVAARGFGANVVSRGEWAMARRGRRAERADHARGGRQDRRPTCGRRPGGGRREPLRWVAIESPEEAAALARRGRLGTAPAPPLDVLYRLNPDVAPETLAGLAVGAGGSKFGMTETEIDGGHRAAGGGADGPLRPRGIHLHVGSQLGAVDAWRDAVREASR